MTKFTNKLYKGKNYQTIEVRKSVFNDSATVYCNGVTMNTYPDENTALSYISDRVDNQPVMDYKYIEPVKGNVLMDIVFRKRHPDVEIY